MSQDSHAALVLRYGELALEKLKAETSQKTPSPKILDQMGDIRTRLGLSHEALMERHRKQMTHA